MKSILDNGYIRFALLAGVFAMTWRLTDWGMRFADAALAKPVADFVGIATTIGAVGTLPIAMLTLLLTKYMEFRK